MKEASVDRVSWNVLFVPVSRSLLSGDDLHFTLDSIFTASTFVFVS